MNKRKIFTIIILIVFFIISIRPMIFSYNFFLYLLNNRPVPNDHTQMNYLINVISISPGIYISILKKNQAIRAVLLNAIIQDRIDYLDLLKKDDIEFAKKKFKNSLFLNYIYGNITNKSNFFIYRGIGGYLLHKNKYNNISGKIVSELISKKNILSVNEIKKTLMKSGNKELLNYIERKLRKR